VSAIGFGAWGLSGDYGPADDAASIETIRRALDLGVNLIDTADEYGRGHNEALVGRAIRGRRSDVVLATKAGIVERADGSAGVSGAPEHLRAALEGSLVRLGVDHVDLFYLHRLDPFVPVEESLGAMVELVREGKARFLGLSEVGADVVRRAHAVYPLAALQSEYSLWSRGVEETVLPALRELAIGFVAFSPLGRGFLAGAVTDRAQLAAGDFRRTLPRFDEENLRRNLGLLRSLESVAAEKGATPAQLALAWLLHQGVVPIPGTRRQDHLEGNLRALEVELGPDDLARLEAAFRPGAAFGARYPESLVYALGAGAA
jgi:aryl-alcohol dehydrogenase-like predicted oxidoreductase